MQQRLKQVLGLTQGFRLDRPQGFVSVSESREFSLALQGRNLDAKLSDLIESQPWFCLSILESSDLQLPTRFKREEHRKESGKESGFETHDCHVGMRFICTSSERMNRAPDLT